MEDFLSNIMLSFFIAMGVILGGGIFTAFAAILSNRPPLKSMMEIAQSIKIWAIATALGGTFSSFQILEEGIFKGDFKALLKQITFIFFSLIGANIGYEILNIFHRCCNIWKK
ncbi:YtrH family sporulation protein [Hathewaya histolytica]|uniref:YtrH family sporulation protein n=1 Tax=Hathewaya histolytica TaxID=1498 RepID=UPI003B66EF3F